MHTISLSLSVAVDGSVFAWLQRESLTRILNSILRNVVIMRALHTLLTRVAQDDVQTEFLHEMQSSIDGAAVQNVHAHPCVRVLQTNA